MTRRWLLWAALSLLIGSALLIVLAIRTPAASPTTIQGWWCRYPLLTDKEFFDASPNPHQLSTLLHFRQDGIFTAEDSRLMFPFLRPYAAPVSYPGTFTFVYPGTFTFDRTQHIQLTMGTITATYEIEFEDGHAHNGLDGRLILRNQGMTYTYYRTHITLEM